jgi:hypothetical protein
MLPALVKGLSDQEQFIVMGESITERVPRLTMGESNRKPANLRWMRRIDKTDICPSE